MNRIKHILAESLRPSIKFQLKLFLATLRRARPRQPQHGKHQGIRILVADDLVPAPDRDAGSARMLLVLRSLRKLGHVVFVSLADVQRAEYEAALASEGIEVQPWYNFRSLLADRTFEVALFSRVDVAAALLPLTRRMLPQCKTIFDTVDINFIRLKREFEISRDPQIERSARKYRRLETKLALSVDQIWCVTDADAAILRGQAPLAKFEIVPTIHPLEDRGKAFSERSGLIFIGSFLHRPNRDAVHFFMQQIFPRIREQIPELIVSIIGPSPPDDIVKYESETVHITGFVADVSPLFTNARVFIAPLRFGSGMKGKIGQALSYGLPVVTTSIGAEGIGLSNGVNAVIADAPREFAEAVVAVYQDENLWQQLSEKGYQLVKERFTPEVIEQNIHGAVRKLID